MSQNPISDSERGMVATLIRLLFNKFITEKGIDTATAATAVRITDFHKWLKNERAVNGLFPDREEIRGKLGTTDEEFDMVHPFMDDPIQFTGFMTTWWTDIAIKEPPLRNPPMAIQIALAFQFGTGEGEFVNVAIPVHQKNHSEPFTTGNILSLFRAQLNSMLDGIILKGGIQALYDENVAGQQIDATKAETFQAKPAARGGPGF